jgi:hypothetical protein
VPRGDARDATRDPAVYDRIAARLHDAGVPWLDESLLNVGPSMELQRTLL